MSAPISIVIPTLDASNQIGPCLASLVPGVLDGLVAELILADGGSQDDVATLAEAAGARLVTAPRGRGTQLAAGCAAAKGEWLLILHADTRLSPDWTRAVMEHMSHDPQRAGWFRLRFDTRARAGARVAGWANFRARAFGLPYGDQGLLVRRDVYRAAGGFPAIPLMEDVSLVRNLDLVPLDATATTSAERYERDGWLTRGWRNLSTLALWYAGVTPERLATRYARSK